MNAPKGYSSTQIALHWAVAALVAAQFIFHDAISAAWAAIGKGQDIAFDPLVLGHVAGGGLILVFVAWRLYLRSRRGVPLPPDSEPAPLKALAHAVHWSFYLVLAGLSLSGLLAWFGGVGSAAQAHNVLKVGLLALVAVHILAVPFHRLVLKTDVMRRMIRAAD